MRSTAAIFGAPVTEPPGNVASSSSPIPTPSRSVPSTLDTMCSTPASSPRRHELRPADRSRLADAREVVALEVDDHHVLGGVLLRPGELVRLPERPRSLDRHRPDALPAPRQEELGRRRHDRPAVADERLRVQRAQLPELGRERARLARERRGQMLDEVHLVDVATRDRLTDALDRSLVLLRSPGRVPRSDDEALMALRLDVRASPLARTRQAASGSGQGSGGGGEALAANDLREAVAEVEVGREALAARGRRTPARAATPRAARTRPRARGSRASAACQPPSPTDACSATSRRARGTRPRDRRRQKIALPATSRSAPASHAGPIVSLLIPPSTCTRTPSGRRSRSRRMRSMESGMNSWPE